MANQNLLEQFYGTYRGLVKLTERMPNAFGELEVTVGGSSIRTQIASGLGINHYEIPSSFLSLMGKEEMQTSSLPYKPNRFCFNSQGYEILAFIKDPKKHEFGLTICKAKFPFLTGQVDHYQEGLLILNFMLDFQDTDEERLKQLMENPTIYGNNILHPATLFNNEQVNRGEYKRFSDKRREWVIPERFITLDSSGLIPPLPSGPQYIQERGFIIEGEGVASAPCVTLRGNLSKVGELGITYHLSLISQIGPLVRRGKRPITSTNKLIKIIEDAIIEGMKVEQEIHMSRKGQPFRVFVYNESWRGIAQELVAKYKK